MMKSSFILLVAILISITAPAQDQLSQKFLARTFMLKYGTETASSFLIRHNDQDFIVTARHLFKNVSKDGLFINTGKSWFKLEGKEYFHTNSQIDIAVFKVSNITLERDPIALESYNVGFGERGYFLGYPYGLVTEDNNNMNGGFPLPLVKGATLSSMSNLGGIITIILDGHNNPGFSGGPVVFKNFRTNKMTIIGVVSAYIPQTNKLVTPVGTWDYFENSGIIVAYGSDHIIQIIESIK